MSNREGSVERASVNSPMPAGSDNLALHGRPQVGAGGRYAEFQVGVPLLPCSWDAFGIGFRGPDSLWIHATWVVPLPPLSAARLAVLPSLTTVSASFAVSIGHAALIVLLPPLSAARLAVFPSLTTVSASFAVIIGQGKYRCRGLGGEAANSWPVGGTGGKLTSMCLCPNRREVVGAVQGLTGHPSLATRSPPPNGSIKLGA